MAVALLWFALSWWPGAAQAGEWVVQRPMALLLLAVGAFLMWLQTPRLVRRPPRGFELSAFKHSTMAHDAGPDTHPVAPPSSAFSEGDDAIWATPQRAPSGAERSVPDAPKKPSRWRAGVLRAIEWQRFEAVCTALFRQDGYAPRVNSNGSVDGAEIWLHSPLNMAQPARIVLCKHVSQAPIDTTTVTQFQSVLEKAKVASGAIVTAGRFSDEAKQLARRNHIAPVDSVNLLTVILRRSEAQQRELLGVATQGEYWRPTCPKCGSKMSARDEAPGSWACGTGGCASTLEWMAEAV
jgi:restriction system protein